MTMPTISMFFGMVIVMYWRDHAPPHFHCHYQGYEGSILLETGELVDGDLPRTARRLLRDWTKRHRAELMENWRRARLGMPLLAIQGADEDDE